MDTGSIHSAAAENQRVSEDETMFIVVIYTVVTCRKSKCRFPIQESV